MSPRSHGARVQEQEAAAQAASQRGRRTLLTVVAAVVVVALLVVGAAVVRARTAEPQAIPGGPSGSDEGVFTVGDDDAPVAVKVYLDLQCPFCKAFEAASGATLDDYVAKGTVKIEYRPVALLDRLSPDRYSSRALNAFACAADDGVDVQKLLRIMYRRQPAEKSPGLTDKQLQAVAATAGADDAGDCIAGEDYATWVKATSVQAKDVEKLQGTPTVEIAGTKTINPDDATLRTLVDAAAASAAR